jgi:non-specific protein-tyrosine kinase
MGTEGIGYNQFIMDQEAMNVASTDFSITTGTVMEDVRRYAGLFWHWGWLLAIFAILGAAAAFFVSSGRPDVYRSRATMLISESRTINEYANILASERLALTYSQLMVQQPVMEGVIERLGLSISPDQLKSSVNVNVVADTQLIEVSVESLDPIEAAQIANTVGTVFAETNASLQSERYIDSKESLSTQLAEMELQIQAANDELTNLEDGFEQVVDNNGNTQVIITLEQQRDRDRLEANLALYSRIHADLLVNFEEVRLAEIQSTSTVRLVEPAQPNSRPIRPIPTQDALLGGVAGLILAMALVLLMEALDDTIKGPRDVTHALGLPVIGFIARVDQDPSGPIAAVTPRSPAAEAFRSLRTNVQYASVDHPANVILVTSPLPKDGKSTISVNLATVLAQSGKKVVIIDSDLRRPTLHKRLRLSNRLGLSDLFVQHEINIEGALRKTKIPNLFLISSGGLPPNPAELVGSEKMGKILDRLQEVMDVIIIDSPPVMAVTDAVVLAGRSDGVLLTVEPGQTKLALARQSVEQLRRSGARILGVVMNKVEQKRSRYYYYQGYYQYQTYNYYNDGGSTNKRKNLRRKGKPRTDTAV